MRLRTSSTLAETKIELQMTPMIDVVFQLLVFFLFTFKIVPVEGEIGVNMPPLNTGAAPQTEQSEPLDVVPIKLKSDPNGRLASIVLGQNNLGTSFQKLFQTLKDTYVGPAEKVEDVQVEIDADRRLLYHYVIRATNAIQLAGINQINFRDPLARPAGK